MQNTKHPGFLGMEIVILVAFIWVIIAVPYIKVKLLPLIWRSESLDFIPGYSVFKLVAVMFPSSGISINNGRQATSPLQERSL